MLEIQKQKVYPVKSFVESLSDLFLSLENRAFLFSPKGKPCSVERRRKQRITSTVKTATGGGKKRKFFNKIIQRGGIIIRLEGAKDEIFGWEKDLYLRFTDNLAKRMETEDLLESGDFCPWTWTTMGLFLRGLRKGVCFEFFFFFFWIAFRNCLGKGQE